MGIFVFYYCIMEIENWLVMFFCVCFKEDGCVLFVCLRKGVFFVGVFDNSFMISFMILVFLFYGIGISIF